MDVGNTDISVPISPITEIAENAANPGTVQISSISSVYFSAMDRMSDCRFNSFRLWYNSRVLYDNEPNPEADGYPRGE